jgi:hypothetical protein
MNSGRFGVVAIVAILAWSGSGCSFLFVSGPPDNYKDMSDNELASLDCTTGLAGPTWDGVGLLLMGSTGYAALLVGGDPEATQDDAKGALAVFGVATALGVLSGVSMGVGVHWVNECRAARGLPSLRKLQRQRAEEEQLRRLQIEKLNNPATEQTTPGCAKDADCKGDRICVEGTCVNPPEK